MSEEPTGPEICSAKGCQAPAQWQLLWNNPKIHTPARRKVWLACDEHQESLSSFLGARGFLKETVAHPSSGEVASGERSDPR